MSDESKERDIRAEVIAGVNKGITAASRMNVSDGIVKIREVALSHLASIGETSAGLDAIAAIDARIACEALARLWAGR